MSQHGSLGQIAILAVLGAAIAATPVTTAPLEKGGLQLAKAFAKDGDDDRDDDRGRDRDDDSSGRGSANDRGSSSSSDDGRGSSSSSDDSARRSDDDSGRGRGRGSDDDSGRSSSSSSGSNSSRSTSRNSSDDGGRSSGIEVSTSDGGRIEIENGRYERKNAAGRTVVERPATADDYRALGVAPPAGVNSASRAATAPSGTQAAPNSARASSTTGGGDSGGQIRVGRVVKAEVSGNDIEVTYSRGWKEEIENGRYELKDPANRTVIERPATQRDRSRLNRAVR